MKRHFTFTVRTATNYMKLARFAAEADQNGSDFRFASFSEAVGMNAHRRSPITPPSGDTQPHAHKTPHHQPGRSPRPMDAIAVARQWHVRIIEAGYRTLAKQLHPDMGGSTEDMARLNRARTELTKLATSDVAWLTTLSILARG